MPKASVPRSAIEERVLAAAGIPVAPPEPPQECIVILNLPTGLYRTAIVELDANGEAWRIVRERPPTTRAIAHGQVMQELEHQYAQRGVRLMKLNARPQG